MKVLKNEHAGSGRLCGFCFLLFPALEQTLFSFSSARVIIIRTFAVICFCFHHRHWSSLAMDNKRIKVMQRYKDEYSKEWPCLIKSSVSENHVFCETCACDFTIAHGGRDDCRRHCDTKKHLENFKRKSYKKKVTTYYLNNAGNEVLKAEMLFTSFLIEHNLPLSCADHAGPLFRRMFPDSTIAKRYGCARTKTNALVHYMASQTEEEIVEILKTNPFTLATDGSNDVNDIKLYPIVVSFYNGSKIETVLLSMCESVDNTGEGIFNVIKNEFEKKNIPWKNCISFSCDNAYTMTGSNKGVIAFLRKVQPSIIMLGCSCHLINLAAKKATAALKEVNVEQFLIQIYYYLDKSSKRKNAFKLCQAVCGLEPHKILKYVSTRWLSLLDTINRVLEQWDALEKFFTEETDDNCEISSYFSNPVYKLYCMFLSNTLPIFNEVNVFLLQESPQIHCLRRKLLDLFTNLLVRFVKPSALSDNSTSIIEIDFKKKRNQKEDPDLVIGPDAKLYIKEKNLTQQQMSTFYSDIRKFFTSSCEYILQKFPLNDELLKHAEVADLALQKESSFNSIEFLLSAIPNVLTEEEKKLLDIEFALYQFETIDEPASSMDIGWQKISSIPNASGNPKYVALPKLMLSLLMIPHSNGPTERIFSIVRKNQTEFRASMSTSTLNALLIEKIKFFSKGEVCHQKKFSDNVLASAKKATTDFVSGQK